jgi:hypothetical protein
MNVGWCWLSLLGIVCCLLLAHTYCFSQFDSAGVVRDTTIVPPSIALQDTSTGVRPFRQTKSAWLAVGLSAGLPGAGQVYNESYWKVPVIAGLAGYWVYEWVKLNNKYKDFRDQYNQSISPSSPSGNQTLLGVRDFYHDERDKFAWYLGALYFVNLVDAYVGAHLYDFDVGPDLTYDGRIVPKVTATIRFRL